MVEDSEICTSLVAVPDIEVLMYVVPNIYQYNALNAIYIDVSTKLQPSVLFKLRTGNYDS